LSPFDKWPGRQIVPASEESRPSSQTIVLGEKSGTIVETRHSSTNPTPRIPARETGAVPSYKYRRNAGREPPPGRDGETNIVDLIPALRAFARTFCRDPTDADDLVQETLLKGLASIDKFEPGTRMKSWLFTIMRNTFYTNIKIYTREAPGLADCASARPISEATQEWTIRGQEVRQAIDRLPASKREILVLIGVLGVSYEEAAEICSCAVGTVKSRLNRARASILEYLGEDSSETLVESTACLAADHLASDDQRRR
jgi:RNA polymerase sigma-70 factor (ECF subfamily)